MKKLSEFVSAADKKRIVVSILNSEVPSLNEELILRTAKKLAEHSGLDHHTFVLESTSNKSEIVESFVGSFTTNISYFKNLSDIKTRLFGLGIKHTVSEEGLTKSFPNPYPVKQLTKSLVESAEAGDFKSFQKSSPNNLREIDCRLLFNMVRESKGQELIEEKIVLNKDTLRERFHAGEIFNIGDTVEHHEELHEILDRGTNYVVLVGTGGKIKKSWIENVSEWTDPINWNNGLNSVNELQYKGYCTKNFKLIGEDSRKEFLDIVEANLDPFIILETLKLMDRFILNTSDTVSHNKIKENLVKLNAMFEDSQASSDFKIGKDGRKYPAKKIKTSSEITDASVNTEETPVAENLVVMDRNRSDNAASGIMNASDFFKLAKKLRAGNGNYLRKGTPKND